MRGTTFELLFILFVVTWTRADQVQLECPPGSFLKSQIWYATNNSCLTEQQCQSNAVCIICDTSFIAQMEICWNSILLLHWEKSGVIGVKSVGNVTANQNQCGISFNPDNPPKYDQSESHVQLIDCTPKDSTKKSNTTVLSLECPSSSYFLDLIAFNLHLEIVDLLKLCVQCNDLKTNKKLMNCFQISLMFSFKEGIQTNLTFEKAFMSTCHTISMDLDIVNGRCVKTDTNEEVCGLHFNGGKQIALITDPIYCSPKDHSTLPPAFWILFGGLIVALLVIVVGFVSKRWWKGHNYTPEDNFSFVVLE